MKVDKKFSVALVCFSMQLLFVTESYSAPPVASFMADPASNTIGSPVAVQFTDTSTESPTSWLWEFGDGLTSTDQHPMHAYYVSRTYAVSLTAANAEGAAIVTVDYIVSTCGTLPVMLESDSSSYDTIMDAYYTASSAGDIIMLKAGTFEEDLYFDADISVDLRGGYDCDFSDNSLTSSINSLTISDGTITIENVGVRPLSSCGSSDVVLCTTSADCTAAGGYWSDNTCIGVVTSAGGQVWMDRNLGATQIATSSMDSAAYGDLYQWGRGHDGHQLRITSATTWTTSPTDDPGHGDFIYTTTSPYDWRVPQNNSLWQGVPGANNPCPAGFRLPTDLELDTERLSWSSQSSAGALASPLKLVAAGFRDRTHVTPDGMGIQGHYWSSTVDGILARNLRFTSSGNANMNNRTRADGLSVRCIMD